MKTVSIHQPQYLPWLGLLDKINAAGLYVILDNVQFLKGGFQNRNTFISNTGDIQMLTIPIPKKNLLDKEIREIQISDNIWQKKHYKFLFYNYKKHPFFDEIMEITAPLFEKKYEFLLDALVDSMKISFRIFGIDPEIQYASEILPDTTAKKENLVIEILNKTNAGVYVSGTGAKSYQNQVTFDTNNIKLVYHSFTHPVYNQMNSKNDFVDGLSSLDMAFNLGLDKCRKLFNPDHA